LQDPEGGKGPIEYRTIERDERQIQRLGWTLNREQAAVFREWWESTLVYGGAWFAAPATWPSLDGRVVKVRRFITAPQWHALGKGIQRVTISAELRGETLLPNDEIAGVNVFEVIVRSGSLGAMTHRVQYEAEYPDLVTFGPAVTENGTQLTVTIIDEVSDNVSAPFDPDNGLSTGTARTSFIDLPASGATPSAVEFEIVSKPAGVPIALGFFTSSFGPSGDLEQWLLGYPSLASYVTSDGLFAGYGQPESDIGGFTFRAGDIIGAVIVEADVFWFKNGVLQGTQTAHGDTNNQAAFVSFLHFYGEV
jgi:hypothetical protein